MKTKGKNKEAEYLVLAEFYRVHYNTIRKIIKRGYAWFKKHGSTIKKLMSDNGLEFTTHHKLSRPKHSFEIALVELNIKLSNDCQALEKLDTLYYTKNQLLF